MAVIMPRIFKNIPVLKFTVRSTGRKFCTKITDPALFCNFPTDIRETEKKVTIVGSGNVGIACAFTILSQGIADSVVIVDKDENKLFGETLDLQHGSLFLKTGKVEASTTYEKTAHSKLSIITAGERAKSADEPRLCLAQKNTALFKEIIPQIVKYSPNTILLIVTNPVDIMTWVAWKLSRFPLNRVFGSGTNIDSARLRFLMSGRFELTPSNCHAYVIGTHGQNIVTSWSVANVAGVKLREMNPKAGLDGDPEDWKQVKQILMESTPEIKKLKGKNCWAVALSVGKLAASVLGNKSSVKTVSTNACGYHGVDFEVFQSLPCVLNANGLQKVVKQPLQKDEKDLFLQTAKEQKCCLDKIELYK